MPRSVRVYRWLRTIAVWLFLLYVVSLPLVRPFHFYIKGVQVPYSDLIFAAVALVWIASLAAGAVRPKIHRLHYFMAAFAGAMTLSAVVSTEPSQSALKLLGVFYLIGIACIAIDLGAETLYFKRIIAAVIVATAITAIAGLLGVVGFYTETPGAEYLLSHYGSLPPGNYPRIRALFENANMMSNFLNVTVLVAFGAASMFETRTRRISTLTGIFGIVAAFFTLSAGFGGLILSLGLYFGSLRTGSQFLRRVCLAVAIVLASAAFAATLVSPDTANSSADLEVLGLTMEPSSRVLIWQNTIERGLEYPILGRGTGTDAASVRYKTIAGQDQLLRDAHNSFLNIFGQAGVIGLAAFLALLGHVLSICRFSAQASPIVAALSAAFVGAMLFQGMFGSFEDARHLWLLIGLIAAASAVHGQHDISPASGSPETYHAI